MAGRCRLSGHNLGPQRLSLVAGAGHRAQGAWSDTGRVGLEPGMAQGRLESGQATFSSRIRWVPRWNWRNANLKKTLVTSPSFWLSVTNRGCGFPCSPQTYCDALGARPALAPSSS